VDILLTSEWPSEIETGLSEEEMEDFPTDESVFSNAAAELNRVSLYFISIYSVAELNRVRDAD
jgi:hypothetical protein